MMPLPPLSVHFPTTIAEAVALHASHPGALYLAGGTDLMPNLKQGLYDSADLVSLSRLSLGGVTVDAGAVTIGAGAVLADLAEDPVLLEHLPALAAALALVAGPLHRNRATLGGNVMLDTRCLFYNQTEAWRDALGGCLKREGDWCHVIGSGLRCVAARSNDSAPLLVALDATLHFETPDGARVVPIRQLYGKDGRFDQHVTVSPSALLVAIRVPAPSRGRRLATYRKVRRRDAIDFPQLGLGLVLQVDDVVLDIAGVIGALMPEPRVLKLDAAVGTRLEDAVIDALAAATVQQSHPQTSIHGQKDWRRHVTGIEMRRALRQLRSDWLGS